MNKIGEKDAVRAKLHYATMIVLIISNICVFGLALLFSHSLLGEPLAYFESIRVAPEIQESQAKQAQYQDTDAVETPRTMRQSLPIIDDPQPDPADMCNDGADGRTIGYNYCMDILCAPLPERGCAPSHILQECFDEVDEICATFRAENPN